MPAIAQLFGTTLNRRQMTAGIAAAGAGLALARTVSFAQDAPSTPATTAIPSGAAAWTDVALGAPPGPGDVLVLEIGGELNTVRQVLESVFLVGPGGELTAVPLSPVALTGATGIPVVSAAPGNVLPPDVAARFRRVADGLELLVVRSGVATVVNGAMTPNGPADASPSPGSGTGDWREGDRVLVRLTAAWRAATPPRRSA